MKRTKMKMLGRQGKINIEANKRLKAIYKEKGITTCEVRLSGCWGSRNLSFHHRYCRDYYRCKDIEQNIKNLSNYNTVLLVCPVCHDKLQRYKELSEKVFKIKLEGLLHDR